MSRPWNELLPHAIEAAAQRDPGREALRFNGRSLSYGELLEQASRTANALREFGLQRRDRVGISLHKGLEGIVALWGIMQAGGVYVPIDPALPAERVAALINDCGIRILFTEGRGRADLRTVAALAPSLELCIGMDVPEEVPLRTVGWTEVQGHDCNRRPGVKMLGDDLAYIIYTSGSTGTPKGIMHSHRSGMAYARFTADYYGLRPDDRIGNHAPMHFDISTFDYFAGAVAGAAVVPLGEEEMMMPAAYTDLLARERISILFVVPLVLTQMVLHGAVSERNLSSLRWIIFGGDLVPIKHLCALAEQLPTTRFSNMYGPAETNGCIGFRLEGVPDGTDGLPIGTAFDNMEILVVDDRGESVQPGGTGEILVRGPTMMLGYWNQPERTEARLFRRSVIPGCDDVFYRTGDLARVREDSNLVFAGRTDRMIKTRGYRVELDEIEAALLSHPAVAEGAVFPVTHEETDRVIRAAAVVADEAVDGVALRRFLAGKLAPYALPDRIEVMAALPKTTSGKIDRTALRLEAERA